MKSKSFSEDAFRHFKDPQGGWNQNQATPTPNHNDHNSLVTQNNYSNYNKQIQAMESIPNAMMNMGRGCLYTDVTRPNGSPNDRAPPMNMERRPGDRGSFSSYNLTTLDPYSAPPPPVKAEASTMMSTSFLKRSSPQPQCPGDSHQDGPPQGGMVQYKMTAVHEECQVSESYTDTMDTGAPARQAEQQVHMLEEKLRCARESRQMKRKLGEGDTEEEAV